MSDLIQRLKDHENEGVTASDRYHLREEAAAEIERLQQDIAPVPRSEVIDRLRERAESAERQRDEAVAMIEDLVVHEEYAALEYRNVASSNSALMAARKRWQAARRLLNPTKLDPSKFAPVPVPNEFFDADGKPR